MSLCRRNDCKQALGNRTEDGENRNTWYEYDTTYGWMTMVGLGDSEGMGGAYTEFAYDSSSGRRTKTTSPEGKVSAYEYKVGGNLLEVKQYGAMGGGNTPTPVAVTEYEYDENGYGSNLTKVVDAEGNWTTYEYDTEGRLTSEVLWDMTTTPTPAGSSDPGPSLSPWTRPPSGNSSDQRTRPSSGEKSTRLLTGS